MEKAAFYTPFVVEAREAMRCLSFVLFALGIVPYFATLLLSLLTGLDLSGVTSPEALPPLIGLLTLAGSEIFRYGESLSAKREECAANENKTEE